MALSVLLVVVGVACVSVGAALVYPPAGLIVLGVCAMCAAYVVRWFQVASR